MTFIVNQEKLLAEFVDFRVNKGKEMKSFIPANVDVNSPLGSEIQIFASYYTQRFKPGVQANISLMSIIIDLILPCIEVEVEEEEVEGPHVHTKPRPYMA